MKKKHTQARKARRLFIKPTAFAYTAPVWLRRFHNMYGADSKAFDVKHPMVEHAVEGLRARDREAKLLQVSINAAKPVKI